MRRMILSALVFAAVPLRAGQSERERMSGQGFFEAPRAFSSLKPGPVPPLPAAAIVGAPDAKGRPDIHSALNFSDVTWPPDLTEDDKVAFEVALNISGSFEGGDAWSNITGNFDGQGLSLGLLNQCLGQGSLQPLLLKMRSRRPEKLKAIFGKAHLDSLFAMLAKWESAQDLESVPAALSMLDEASRLDLLSAGSRNAASVTWARENLYDGAHFEAKWKEELVALASDPDYVSLQIEAALGYHLKAVGYETTVGVREFRDYLFLFDIVVQNGGIYPEDLSDYADYLKAAPKASNTQKLDKLLDLRLRHVRTRFKADVRARKSAIINGTGIVHGDKRDLPKELNYDPLWVYR